MTEDTVKIYLAARYNGGRADPRSNNPHQQAAASEPYPHHLESYHYVGRGQVADAVRHNKHQLFMDSGAFSMFTLGIGVDLDAYGRYLRDASDYIEVASNVDAIGAGKERISYENQKYLESLHLPVPVCPVHHARDDDAWLVRYIDEGYPYIFLGGMVPESTPYLIEWLDRIWDKYLALPDGSARVKVHGFGLTTFELMERYPWFSVDSTSWVQIAMFGSIIYPVNGKPRTLTFSSSSPAAKVVDKSYWTLDALTRAEIDKVLTAEGFDPQDLASSYGWRDKWNIRFYRRYMETLRPVFKRKQVTFF
jgi:hypothetical protein